MGQRVLDAALNARKCGLSFLPLEEGSKRPYAKLLPQQEAADGRTYGTWSPFQECIPSEDETRRMFSNGSGIGIITGRVSGNLELLDFDIPGKENLLAGETRVPPAYGPFTEIVKEHGFGELLERLVIIKSRSGGMHLVYRCTGQVDGNKALAHQMHGGKSIAVIETRGEGGYFATCPTPGYKMMQGRFSSPPVITEEEREFLLNCARSLEEVYDEPIEPWKRSQNPGITRPGDVFNATGELAPLLLKAGWQEFGRPRGDRSLWVRPGKDKRDGPSATLDSSKGLYVFSSNAAPFEPGRGYSKFEVFTRLECKGDFTFAAQQLLKQGFGKKKCPVSRDEANYAADRAQDDLSRPKFILLDDVIEEAIEWVWPPFLARGMTAMIGGDPGVGKGMCLKAIASAITLGRGLPGMPPREPGNVLLLCPEDSNGKITRPIMRLMGADMKRVKVLDGKIDDIVLNPEFAADIEQEVIDWDVQLIGIDPIISFVEGEMEMSKAPKVRAVMKLVTAICERHNITGIVNAHLAKNNLARGIHRVAGSVDFTASVRSVWLAVEDPDDKDKRALVHVKNNWGKMGESQGYAIVDDVFGWTGHSDLTSDRAQELPAKQESLRERDKVKQWLYARLMAGPVAANTLLSDAKDMGMSERTLKRAKMEMGITSEKRTNGDGVVYSVWVHEDSAPAHPRYWEDQ